MRLLTIIPAAACSLLACLALAAACRENTSAGSYRPPAGVAQVASSLPPPTAPSPKPVATPDNFTLPELDEGLAGDPNRGGTAAHPPPSTLPPEPAHPAAGTPVSADANVAPLPGATPSATEHVPVLSAAENAALHDWLASVGNPRPNETFGEFVIRIARAQLGKPYGNPPNPRGVEALRLSFRSFQCVSFVESTLAVARCAWRNTPQLNCIADELTRLRYRGGHIAGYVSRLHYYEDWLADNAGRDNLELITQRLGGTATPRQARYMTHHPELYGPLADPKIFASIAAMEARVGALRPAVIPRDQVPSAAPRLQSGDVVAITTFRPDILVSHTGFAYRRPDGSIHMVHASSAKHRVVETENSLSDYLHDSAGRHGLMVARPLPPR